LNALFFSAPALWTFVMAQDGKLTIEEAMRIAETNAFSVRVAKSSVERTRQQVNEVKGNLGPQVRVNNTYTRFDKEIKQQGSVVRPFEQTETQLVLRMPVDITGILKRGLAASSIAVKVAEANLDSEKNDLRFSVRADYYQVLQAQAQVKVFEEALDSARKRLRNTELEYEAGSKAKVDVLRFQTQVQQAEADLIAAKNGLSLARNAFNNTLGRPIETPFELVEEVNLPAVAQDEKALTETAVKNRSELRAFRYNAEVLKNVRIAEERGMLPSLDFSAIHSRNWNTGGAGSQDQTTFGQITLSIPAWDDGITRARVKQARQDEEQNKIRTEQTELAISLEIRQATTNLANAKARWDVAKKQVEFATETFRLANVRYEAGEGIPLEVTDAQAELTRARVQMVAATYDYLTTYAQLQRALGTDVPSTEAKILTDKTREVRA